jgi:hypothetical protein
VFLRAAGTMAGMKAIQAVLLGVVVVSAVGCSGKMGDHPADDSSSGQSTQAAPSDDYAPADDPSASSDDSAYQSEAERTQAMEQKAADLDAKRREIMQNGGSDAELMQAAQQDQAGRDDLNQMGEDGSNGGGN